VQASLADLLADARLQGAFAVSVPGPAAGVAESESAAVLMDDSVHMRVSRNSYERIGVAGVKAGSGMYDICVSDKGDRLQTLEGRLRDSKARQVELICCTADGHPLDGSSPAGAAAVRLESHPLAYTNAKLEMPAVAMAHLQEAGWVKDCLSSEDLAELQDWIQLVCCAAAAAQSRAEVDWSQVSSPLAEAGSVECHSWTGLIVAAQVGSLFKQCRRLVDSGAVPWAAVALRAFPHLPASVYRHICAGSPAAAAAGQQGPSQPPHRSMSMLMALPHGQYITTCS